MAAMRKELTEYADDQHLRPVVLAYLSLLLELSARYYERQFKGEPTGRDAFGRKVDTILERYYAEGKQASPASRPSVIAPGNSAFHPIISGIWSAPVRGKAPRNTSGTS